MHMMNAERIFNVSFQIWGCLLSVILLLCLLITRQYRTRSEKYFVVMIGLNILVMLSDAIAYFFRGKTGGAAFVGVRVSNFAAFISGSLMASVFMLYVIFYIEERQQQKVKVGYRITAAAMPVLVLTMLLINTFRPFIYAIGADNLYRREGYYTLILLPTFTALFVSLQLILSRRKLLDKWELIPLQIYIFAPVIGIFCSALVYGIVFADIGSTAAIIIMFLSHQMKQNKLLIQKEAELSQSKIDIAMSQIRPHFLYNTLGTLSVLCGKDPALASKAMDDFSLYLRKNLDSLNRSTPVRFEDELAHVRNYVSLEKLRFGEDIQITYDIQENDFMIPAISVQPIVENSILHGMMGRDGVCHIEIRTRLTEDGEAEIVISDDGVGFDVNAQKNDGRSHIGIANVRTRIELMTGGFLQIESAPGTGTSVTIRIPKDYSAE